MKLTHLCIAKLLIVRAKIALTMDASCGIGRELVPEPA